MALHVNRLHCKGFSPSVNPYHYALPENTEKTLKKTLVLEKEVIFIYKF